jgi:hypothetical protein
VECVCRGEDFGWRYGVDLCSACCRLRLRGVGAFLGTALLAASWPVIVQILRVLFAFGADPSTAQGKLPAGLGESAPRFGTSDCCYLYSMGSTSASMVLDAVLRGLDT